MGNGHVIFGQGKSTGVVLSIHGVEIVEEFSL